MDDPQPYDPKRAKLLPCRGAEYESQETINNDNVKQQLRSQLEMGTEILNLTGVPITITTRFGERYTLSPRFDTGPVWKRALFFTIRRRASDEVKIQPPYRSESDSASVASRAYNGLVNQERSGILSQSGTRMIKMGCSLTLKELKSVGGRLYMDDLDIVISLAEPTAADHHPYSRAAIEEYMALRWSDEASFMFRMYIVDNDRRYSSRYFNFNNRIYRIPVVYKDGVRDGVYVVHPPEVSSGLAAHGPVKYDATHMTMEEAEKAYNLYATVADAETYGFSKEGLARENAQTKRVVDQAKLLYDDEERRFKLETMERDRAWEREKWEHEQRVRREEAEMAREKAEAAFREKLEEDRRRAEKQRREEEQWSRDIEMARVKSRKELLAVTSSMITVIVTMVVTLVKVTKGK